MFYVVNMDTCTIEKWVKVKKELGGILCFEKLKDNKTIVCGEIPEENREVMADNAIFIR